MPDLKRVYDVVFAGLGLVLLSPLLITLALLIKLADGSPILYRQPRIGQHGCTFQIWKFRTMVVNADQAGPGITRKGDQRVTRLGQFLRAFKLDELPQLWNVLKGEMSLVGPRPEIPKFVAFYTPAQYQILTLKPGITDLATLQFRDEETLLQNAENVESFYLQFCLPRKLQLNQEYACHANLLTDTWIILQTLGACWGGLLLRLALRPKRELKSC